MNILIVGCGRIGSTLARLTCRQHDVTIVDRTSEAFRRLGPDFHGHRLVGPGTDRDILVKAGIEKADAFVAVTDGDNRNIMAAQIAKRVYQVPIVLTRIYDPSRAHVFREMGIHVLNSTSLAAGFFRDIIEDRTPAGFEAQVLAYLDEVEKI